MLIGKAEFPPPRGGEAVLVAILRGALRSTMRVMCSPQLAMSMPMQRFGVRQVAHLTRFPGAACVERATVAGVPGEWVRLRQASAGSAAGSAAPTILYLHGGAFCVGSRLTHRAISGRLAIVTGLPIFVAEYRLAPEHPYPAALDDCVAAYLELRKKGPVIIAGDSAGGGLTLSTPLALREKGVPLPAALILFSPWVDLSTKYPPGSEPPGEAMLSIGWLESCARHYLGDRDPRAPLVSPLFGELRGLPPILIQVGTDELLAEQSLRLFEALQKAEVDVACQVYRGLWHVFQLHAGVLPSSNAAIKRVQDFLATRLP